VGIAVIGTGLARIRASLHLRLSLVLLLLFAALAVATLAVFGHFSRNYQNEVMQRLNRDVATYIAKQHRAIGPDALDAASLAELFPYAMILNPVVELYVLDAQGVIVASGPMPGPGEAPLAGRRVPLEPVRAFLSGAALPVFGTDPRNGSSCVFSAAPLGDPARPIGYVYALLSSPASEAAMMAAGGSYGLTLAAASIVACALFLAVSGLLLFRALTGRLQNLADRVDRFAVAGAAPPPRSTSAAAGRDEIERLASAFDALAARIAAQVAQLEAVDRGRREAVLNASHDLRTPLAALQGYLQTLLLKSDVLSQEQTANYLSIAQRHAERLNALVEQMFALAKLDAPEAAPVRERFSIAELAGDVVQKFQLRASQRGIALAAAIDADTPPLEADIGLVERLLENLVENALKFTPAGGRIDVQVGTRPAADGQGRCVIIAVTDTGCGISPEDLPRVFDRFYRAGRADIERREAGGPEQGGSGLGLAIVKRIAQLHGASVEVQSTPGQGSRFVVVFPPS
jgi:signal transduction histidine kinase